MDKKMFNRLLLLLFLLIILICAIIIFDNKDNLFRKDETIEEKNRFVFNFGEPIDLDSKYGYEDIEIRGTDSNSNYGSISELYDESSMWTNNGNLIVETAHGYVTYSNEWVDEGVATIIEEPDFGNIIRFVLQEGSLKAKYDDVEYDDIIEYAKKMKEIGFTKNAKEEKSALKGTYSYEALNENKEWITLTLMDRQLTLQAGL